MVRCHVVFEFVAGGAGGELCRMHFGNLEGWRLSVFSIIVCKIVY